MPMACGIQLGSAQLSLALFGSEVAMGVPEEQHPGLPDGYLRWSQEQRVALPSREPLIVVSLPRVQRLHKHVVDFLSRRRVNYATVYSSLFAAAVAIGASIPALMWADGLPAWVAITYIFAASICVIIGFTFVFVSRVLGSRDTQVVSDIDQEFLDLGPLYSEKKPTVGQSKSS